MRLGFPSLRNVILGFVNMNWFVFKSHPLWKKILYILWF